MTGDPADVSSPGEPQPSLEERRVIVEERLAKVEERKAKQGFITRLVVLIPLVAVLATFSSTIVTGCMESRDRIRVQELEAEDAFDLKVIELVMGTRGPFETRNRANAIQQLFPDRVRADFSASFDPKKASDAESYRRDQRVASKKELLAILVEHPDDRALIIKTWRQMFPGDKWARGLK